MGLMSNRTADIIIKKVAANFLKAGSGWCAFGEIKAGLGEITFHNGRKIRAKKPTRPSGPY
jgi:hypothetical protein